MTSQDVDEALVALLQGVEGLADVPVFVGQNIETLPAEMVILVACGALSGVSPKFQTGDVRVTLEGIAYDGDGARAAAFRTAGNLLRDTLWDKAGLMEGWESEVCELIGSQVIVGGNQGAEDGRWFCENVVRVAVVKDEG